MKSNTAYEWKFGLYLLYTSILIIFASSVIVCLLQFPIAIAQHTSVDIYNLDNKGVTLFNSGNYTGAIKYYDKDLAINPNDINTLNNKGVALDSLGNYTGAIKYYDKALAINPNDINTLNNKGVALDNLGNYTGAIKYYDKVCGYKS